MTEWDLDAKRHCETGLQHLWRGEVDAALAEYDRGLALETSDETRELLTIRKAEALIAGDREGAEVAALAGIVMRRRVPYHVYLAAYTLMRKFSEEEDGRKRALFYGELARTAADELGEPFARISALNGLGVVLVIDSRFREAIEKFDAALAIAALHRHADARIAAMQYGVLGNLGGAKVLCGDTDEGLRTLLHVLPHCDDDSFLAEVCLDLACGHLDKSMLVEAESFARRALANAQLRRQRRNAYFLLGEICVRGDRYDEADEHFEAVAAMYPEFRNVKQLLVAVDLSSVVNWKA